MKPAKRILEKAKSTDIKIIFHNDQGVQYSSAGYCNLFKSYNFIQSISRANVPRDNTVIESFFGRFKDVILYHLNYKHCHDIIKVISDNIHYFNYIKFNKNK